MESLQRLEIQEGAPANFEMPDNLADLGALFDSEFDAFRRRTVADAVRLGGILITAKDRCEHGDWLRWLERRGVSERTARHWMTACRKSAEIADLPPTVAQLLAPSRPTPKREGPPAPASKQEPASDADQYAEAVASGDVTASEPQSPSRPVDHTAADQVAAALADAEPPADGWKAECLRVEDERDRANEELARWQAEKPENVSEAWMAQQAVIDTLQRQLSAMSEDRERVRGLVRSRDKTLQALRRHMDNIGDGEGLRRFFGRAPRD